MKDREEIISNYIEGYNNFDVEMMSRDLDDNLLFENISNGEVTDSLVGKPAFIDQAENAKSFFAVRHQKVTSITHFETYTEVNIDYNARLSKEFADELNIGDKITLKGKSIFEFGYQNKITGIKDIS